MKNNQLAIVLSLVFFLCLSVFHFEARVAEARVGGGRSFGSRGSRSMGPRAYQPSPQRATPYSQPAPNRMSPTTPYQAQQAFPPSSGGGFLRNFAGGLAGGMIGSMLFRGFGGGGSEGQGTGGRGGFGFLELLLLGGGLYLLYRWMSQRRALQTAGGAVTAFASGETLEPIQNEDTLVDILREHDRNFDPRNFKEARTDDFFKLQAALMRRDLSSVKNKVTAEIYTVLEKDVATLRNNGKINKLENITLRETEIVEAWQEVGKEYATLRILANLLDYSVDEKTGEVVGGSTTDPIKFEECWTFARDTDVMAESKDWRLTAVEQMTPNV